MPPEMADEAAAARETLIERVVEADDDLMMRYLEGEQLSTEELIPALRCSIRERSLFPVIPGASPSNVGIGQLLDAIAEVLDVYKRQVEGCRPDHVHPRGSRR